MQYKDYDTLLFGCLRVLLVPQNAGCTVRITSAANLNNSDKLWGGYKTFRPRLTKYCRGCVPGGGTARQTHTNSHLQVGAADKSTHIAVYPGAYLH